ncbi:MAG: GTP 3',8-cyclase MoaA [Blastocatellia bacterium]|nr:GTP 3',8-cyclase MoaA [Blastocatellia bacterium]
MLTDAYNRTIRDLRISLTDRCNFRCFYCLPHGEPAWARKEKLLNYEEIAFLAEVFVELGIRKIRLTGGEPLVRRDVSVLVRMLAELKPELSDIALTTNGYDFVRHADDLKEAGLDRVTFSVDTLRRERFEKITGVDALEPVLASIETAKRIGLEPVKVNAVIVRGRNEDEVVELAAFAREHSVSMRFIEYMPLDAGHGWRREDVVSGREIRKAISEVFPIEAASARASSTSQSYRFVDGSPGEIGIIASVTEMFCGACSRIRLTADGQIRTCLFSKVEHDLAGPLRNGAAADEIAELIRNAVAQKEAQHYINEPDFVQPERTMSFIGG